MEALFTVIARSMGIEALQVEAVMTLLREGSSVPFIARYRKERTKGLDEEQIRQIEEAYQYQTHLEKRKEDVLRLIDQQGMLDEALEIVAAVRSRYDGIRRNPWNEIECGFYYARSLASWGLLLAASGFDWDAPRRKICFQPRIASGNLFWTTGSAWGNVFFDENSLRISPRHSVLTLRCIQIPEGKTVCRVVANGTEIAFTQRGCEVDLPETEIGEGGVLAIEY